MSCLKLGYSVSFDPEESSVNHPAIHAAGNGEWRCWRIPLKSEAGTTSVFLITNDCADLRALLADRPTAIKRLPHSSAPTFSLRCKRLPALVGRLRASAFAHRVGPHFDTMSVMHEAIKE